jgi:hypothetical protein
LDEDSFTLRDPSEALAANSWRLRTLNILDRTMSYNEVRGSV